MKSSSSFLGQFRQQVCLVLLLLDACTFDEISFQKKMTRARLSIVCHQLATSGFKIVIPRSSKDFVRSRYSGLCWRWRLNRT